MRKPGTKVLHIQDIDYHSNCLTLVRCLTQLRAWSNTNAGHVPIAVLLEFKDTPWNIPGVKTVVPPAWTRPLMLGVEREIAGVFRRHDLITPDDVRRPGMTLERSVLTHGWPTLRSARGKVMFLMDNEGAIHDRYTAGNPSLEHRLIFTNGVPGRPDAAFVKRNDPDGRAAGADPGPGAPRGTSCGRAPTPTLCRRAAATPGCGTRPWPAARSG